MPLSHRETLLPETPDTSAAFCTIRSYPELRDLLHTWWKVTDKRVSTEIPLAQKALREEKIRDRLLTIFFFQIVSVEANKKLF